MGSVGSQGREPYHRTHCRAIDADAGWQATFAELEGRLGRNRAIVATARRLLVQVWETLAACEAAQLAARQESRAA